MSREILLLVDALAREKNVAKDIVFPRSKPPWPLRPRNASTTMPTWWCRSTATGDYTSAAGW